MSATGNRGLIVLCFAIIYTIWGSTYLANIIAIETIPPFLMVAGRLVVAGALLAVLARILGYWEQPTRRQWRDLAISGFLFLGVGLGLVVYAEQYIESGITAMIIALEPLMVILVMWAWERQRPGLASFIGIALGIGGSYLLVGHDAAVINLTTDWRGLVAIFISMIAWAFASVYINKADMPKSQTFNAAWQMIIAGSLLLPIALLSGEHHDFQFSQVSARSWWAVTFLITLGSIVGFSAFNYLLRNVSPEKVATSTYVHPVVALFLGWWLRDEPINAQILVAGAIMLTGVFVINSRPRFWRKLGAQLTRSRRSVLMLPRQGNRAVLVRRWRGITRTDRADQFADYLEREVLPAYAAVEGNLGYRVQHRQRGPDEVEFTVKSYWKDLEAVKGYAGTDYHRARYHPGERELLLRGDDLVRLDWKD